MRRSMLVVLLAGAVAAAAAAAVASVVLGDVGPLLAVTALACFVAGRRTDRAVVVGGVVAVAVVALTAGNQLVLGEGYSVLDDVAFFVLVLGTPAIVGYLLGRRTRVIAELAGRAIALREARAEQAAAAIAEERARLAIGVHDALAHRVGEISLQAAGAQRVAEEEPGRALLALARIEDTARAALHDIRGVVGVLRRGDDELSLAPHRLQAEAVPAPWAARSPEPAPSDGRTLRTAGRGPDRDVVIAAAVFAAIVVEGLTSTRMEGPALLNVLGIAAIAAPLAVRRRRPLASVVLVFAAAALQSLLLTPMGVLVAPIVLLLVPPFSVGAHLPLRPALAGLAVFLAGSSAVEPAVVTLVLGALAWTGGRLVRDRGRRAEELAAVTAELERTGDAHAARARGEERLRVARELHDAVAHSMTVIVLQAGAAQRVWASDPAAARVAVDALAGVARDTLAELRVRLRAADPHPAGDEQVEALVARMRPLGLDVALDRDPAVGELPPPVAAAVFGVVQEALTNAARHAAPTSVHVRIGRLGDDVHVDVIDTGRRPGERPPGAPIAGTGTGLRGMDERVAACGGSLHHGPAGPGYRVEARMPLAPQAVAV